MELYHLEKRKKSLLPQWILEYDQYFRDIAEGFQLACFTGFMLFKLDF